MNEALAAKLVQLANVAQAEWREAGYATPMDCARVLIGSLPDAEALARCYVDEETYQRALELAAAALVSKVSPARA